MTAELQGDLQTLLQALSAFDSADVTLGDYLVLDRGSPPYAVILPGPFTTGPEPNHAFGGETTRIWTIYVEIIADFLTQSYSQLNTTREAVIDKVLANQSLGNTGTYYVSDAISGGELFYIYPEGGADQPHFVVQRISIVIEDNKNYSGTGEFS
jgi:hypothetical protein